MDKFPSVFINGKFYHGDNMPLSPSDRGITLGDGLFETIRLNKKHIPTLLAYHWDRLCCGLNVLGIPNPLSLEKLNHLIFELVEKNDLPSDKEGFTRIMVTRGNAPRGLLPPDTVNPTIIGTVGTISETTKELSLAFATNRRNEFSSLSNIKSTCYLDSILAKIEANNKGFDDALFLNTQGRIAETTVANLFIYNEQSILTPPINDGVLPGIMRKIIMEVTSKAGFTVKETSLSINDINSAEEIFVSSSLIKVQRVSFIESTTFKPKNLNYFIMIKKLINEHLSSLD